MWAKEATINIGASEASGRITNLDFDGIDSVLHRNVQGNLTDAFCLIPLTTASIAG